MKLRIALAGSLMMAPAIANTPYSAPALSQDGGLGVFSHCVVFMSDGSKIHVANGGANPDICTALGRRCAGSQPFNAITHYSNGVYTGGPYRVCTLS